jgi:hypothetical protein
MTDHDIPMGLPGAGSARTVGELLREADLAARRMLTDTDPATAPARVRSWAEVVETAAQTWRTIPTLGPHRGAVDADIDALHDLATGVHRLIMARGWPAAGAPDSHAEQVVANMSTVGDLVASRHRATDVIRPEAGGDLEAARTWIMHTVLAATHAVRRSLEQYERAMISTRERTRLPAPTGERVHVRELIRRVDAAEGLAAGYLDLRWPATARGERLDPIHPTRLEAAIATWQTQAARALTSAPSVADLSLVVRTQLDGSVLAFAVAGSSTHAGLLTAAEGARMQRAQTGLERAASGLLESFRPLTGRNRTFQAPLAEAAAELRAAIRDIVYDGTSLAGSDTLRERVDISRALSAVQQHLTGGVALGWRILDDINGPHLQVRASGAHQIASQSHQPTPSKGWVEAGDLVANRLIGLPSPVRFTLRHQTQEMTDRAIDAAAASYPSQPRRAATPASDGLTGRQHQDRQPPTLGPDNPGPSIGR